MFRRIQIDLAIPEKLNPVEQKIYEELLVAIKSVKAFSTKINEGKDNEENTVKAITYLCGHDDGLPCTDLEDIK